MRIVRPDQSWCIFCFRVGNGYRVGELCSELDCSERYFYTVFTRDIGLAPKEWMRRERMAVARRKLADGRPLVEVAADLGFSSKNCFRREFLRFYQVGPG